MGKPFASNKTYLLYGSFFTKKRSERKIEGCLLTIRRDQRLCEEVPLDAITKYEMLENISDLKIIFVFFVNCVMERLS